MKKLFLIFFFLSALPTSVSAESVWLVLQSGNFNGSSLVKIEMEDITQCELMGAKWLSTERVRMQKGFECFKGK